MRLIFFGMSGQFSVPPLEKLLAVNVDICAVIVPTEQISSNAAPQRVEPPAASPTDLPLLNPHLEHNILHVAWAHRIPVWQVTSLTDSQTQSLLSDMHPDLIVVACFSKLFPAALLQLPRHGCLNLHPSLLPAYRGPAPLFWIARNDERTTGVTLHFLDEALDTGDIVAQARIARPDGTSETELDRLCAEKGANLLTANVLHLVDGQPLPRQPQSESEASYFPWPSASDFVISTDWSARRAFNFLRGAENWPLAIKVEEQLLGIHKAISYDLDQTLDQPYVLLDDELWVQFEPGVLRAKILN